MRPAVAVDAVSAAAYDIPTDAAESDGTLAWQSTTLVVVEVSGGGRTGLGYTYGSKAIVPLIEGKLAETAKGADVGDVRSIWAAMVHDCRNLGVSGLTSMAISAVDTALWDLFARVNELPLSVALGASSREVPIYGSGGFTSYDDDQLRTQLAGWVEQGIPRVKIKVGREPAADPHRLAVTRQTVGDEVEVLVDANGAFVAREAIRWAHRYREEWDVRWFEEPVSSDDLAGMRQVLDQAPGGIDVAAGEYCWTPWSVTALLSPRAVDCLQVDVTRCLGITGFLAAAATAEAHQTDVSAHCAPQISAHACTPVRRLRHLEYFHDHVRIERMAFENILQPRPGGVLVPDRSTPGHGLELKRTDLEQFRVA